MSSVAVTIVWINEYECHVPLPHQENQKSSCILNCYKYYEYVPVQAQKNAVLNPSRVLALAVLAPADSYNIINHYFSM